MIQRIFNVAAAVLVVHAVDDAIFSRGPGVGVTHHLPLLLLTIATTAAVVYAFGRSRPGVRALLALALAVPGGANGAMHFLHVTEDRLAGGALTGVAALMASLVLVGLAAVIPWHGRHEVTTTPRRRWALRLGALPAAYFAIPVLIMPTVLGITGVHKPRHSIGPAPAGYQAVTFDASDGLELHGWYRPSANGAAVIVAHGGGSTRQGALRHAQMLAGHGYGVLVYDARGAGESEGPHNSWGWDWEKDAEGALEYLQDRPDVDDDRIGALGLSSGADALLAAAADHPELGAVIGDGTAARTFEDIRRSEDLGLDIVAPRLMFGITRALSGQQPGQPLEDAARETTSPLLLISADREMEWRMSRRYVAAAGDNAEHWNLPDASHTKAIKTHREEYERRVVAFLDRNLSPTAEPAR